MIKRVFFDLDNCVYDTDEQVKESHLAGIRAMIERGLPGTEEYLCKKLTKIRKDLGSNNRGHYNTLVREVFEEQSIKLTEEKELEIVSGGTYAYRNEKLYHLTPSEDAIPTLTELINRGYEVGILTKGVPEKQWDKINSLRGLYELVKGNVWIANEDESKVRCLHEILDKYELSTEEILVVGDRQNSEIRDANNVGVPSAQLMKGPYKNKDVEGVEPTYRIDNLSDLLELPILNNHLKQAIPARTGTPYIER